jgi:hypothetical protein
MADKKREDKYTENRDGGVWTKPSQKGAKSYKLTNEKDKEDWLTVAGTPLEGAFSQRFVQNAGTGKGNYEADSTLAKIRAGVSTNTDSKDIKDPKKKEAVQKAEQKGMKQSQQTSDANTAYDAATETPSSEVKDSKTALKNIQKVANDINEGKVDTTNMSREEIEKLGTDAATNPEDLTQTTEMNDVEKSEADSIGWDGKSPPSPETQDAAQATVDKISPEEQNEMAKSKLGGWEKLAVALTVLSFAAAAVTGGEILPVNLIGLTGVDQRLAEMHKANAELDKFNKIKEQWKASEEKKNGMSLEQYTALVGKASRNVTEQGGAETNQSEHELTMADKQLATQLKLIDAQGNWDMQKLKAQLSAAASEGRLNREQQLALARLNNSSNEKIANTAMVGEVLGSAFGGISGILRVLNPAKTSDKNSKIVKHTYIPKEKRGY